MIKHTLSKNIDLSLNEMKSAMRKKEAAFIQSNLQLGSL